MMTTFSATMEGLIVTKRYIRTFALCLLLVVGLASTVSANTARSTWIEGDGYFNSTSSTSAKGYATTYAYQLGMGAAEWIEARVDIFKGGTWIDIDSWLTKAEQTVTNVTTSGNWQLTGWHFASWESGTVEDSCATYDPPLALLAQPAYPEITEYRIANPTTADWAEVSYISSSQMLKAMLDHKTGVALDRLFHSDLTRYLRPGDKVPILLIAPDKTQAIALFFHGDGSITEVRIDINEGRVGIASVQLLDTIR